MHTNRSRPFQILLSPCFLTAIALLLLNDFYLKAAYGNFVTGKLSDFAGLFTFSLFLSALFPTRALRVHIAVGIAFVFWKTPFADSLIDTWNSLGFLLIERTVDYSDYLALTVLPFSYSYFTTASESAVSHSSGLREAALHGVVILSVFAFAATSSSTNRTLTLPERFAVRESRVELEQLLLNEPLISNLVPYKPKEASADPDNPEQDDPVYFFEFKVAEKTCDSEVTRMSMMIRERPLHTEIISVDINFECGAYGANADVSSLNRTYIEHARELFTRTVLSKLTLYDPNDKTPRPRP
ncbi:MAG TPA: hypothetical protein VJV05_06745 [Pyrinomonadaceae bacterium]|nr:hypothetical protein [Pyrinomonadaceae bacterium]